MNEVFSMTKDIEKSDCGDIAKNILKFCIAVTPQFYKNKTKDELQAEKTSIELLTSHIDPKVLASMCEMAVLNYPKLRVRNEKAYFDVNYILSFYIDAFNKVYCEEVDVKDFDCVGESYDEHNNVVSEFWKKEGRIKTVRYMYPNEEIRKWQKRGDERFYTPKFFENLYANLADIDAIEV